VSGADVGTLAQEFNSDVLAGTGTDGRIHAKTGSLSGAKALSGFFDLADGRKVAFSMLINGAEAAERGRILWAAMATGLKDLASSVTPAAIALPGA
jgi:D-alanyl-D-alanine carboxypeptidase/D-alanyl-D-alanine-endopeptidase (penicillin-binding protein 4)